MDQLKDLLLTTIRGIPDVPDRLANDVSAYVNAVEAREERIERFKTGYAIIRNSARYLPLAAAKHRAVGRAWTPTCRARSQHSRTTSTPT